VTRIRNEGLEVMAHPTAPGVRRRDGRGRVVEALASRGAATRAEIARATGLAPSTVTSLIAGLLEEGLVEEGGEATGGVVGRPGQVLRLGRQAGVVVGIDLGRRHLKTAVCDLSHGVLARQELGKSTDQHASEDIELIAAMVEQVLDVAGVARHEVLAVAMGLPGPVHTTGELGDSTILPGWVGVRAQEALTEALGLPVRVDNDANLGALSESKWGAGAGVADLVYLKVSTGIGAGLVINGQLFRGAGHTAGEIGHTVIDPGGPVCRCGNRGCLEMYAGSQAILSSLRPAHPEVHGLARVVELAQAGEAGCARVIADAGRSIGAALATLCNMVNPGCVVVGGTLSLAGELLLEPMRAAVRRGAVRSAADDVRVTVAALGHDAEMMGAVALALESARLAAR
jgi:predicted NBD/HSP70 family sugar kinase